MLPGSIRVGLNSPLHCTDVPAFCDRLSQNSWLQFAQSVNRMDIALRQIKGACLKQQFDNIRQQKTTTCFHWVTIWPGKAAEPHCRVKLKGRRRDFILLSAWPNFSEGKGLCSWVYRSTCNAGIGPVKSVLIGYRSAQLKPLPPFPTHAPRHLLIPATLQFCSLLLMTTELHKWRFDCTCML